MTDDRVERLLKDLEAALVVEPSPAVAAGARRRMAERRVPFRIGYRGWAGAAGVVVSLIAVYAVWGGTSPASLPVRPPPPAPLSADIVLPAPSPSVARVGSATTAPAMTPRVAPRGRALPVRADRPGQADTRGRTGAPGLADVLVSPSVRVGLRQLERAISEGRIMAESLAGRPLDLQPTIIVPTVIVAEPLTIGDDLPGASGDPAGGGASPPVSYRSFASDQDPLS